jgi:hypothetical protein
VEGITGLIGASGLGVFAVVVLYLLNANRLDRKGNQELLERIQNAHAEEVERLKQRSEDAERRLYESNNRIEEARLAKFAAEEQREKEKHTRSNLERQNRRLKADLTKLRTKVNG